MGSEPTTEKNAQVSIFMIIGVVLLLLASFLMYIQKYAIERQSELEMKGNALLNGDMEAFEEYLSSAFEDSAFNALELWGEGGGFDNSTTDLPKKTYGYDASPLKTNNKTLVYLYNGGENLYNLVRQEESVKNLSWLIESAFLNSIESTMFEEKGYEFSFAQMPKVEIYLSDEGGTATIVMQSNARIWVDGFALTFSNFTVEIPVGLNEIIQENSAILNDIDSSAPPYDFSTDYSLLSPNISVCGYGDGADSIIRVTYHGQFLQHDEYNLTFLVQTAATGCKP